MDKKEIWLPEKLVSYKFFVISILLFPITLLLAASFQPRVFFDKESVWYLFSANIFFLHLIIFTLLILLFIVKFGGLKLSDVGLKSRNLLTLLWVPLAVWLGEQIILGVLVPFGFAEFKINSIWLSQTETIKSISSFFANLLATGLNEETFFRGFVFAQLYKRFGGETANEKLEFKPFILAAFISAVIFALMHLQTAPAALLFLMIGGLIGCLVYVRTRNIFVGIGIHGVFNSPMPLLETGNGTAKLVVISLMLVLVIFYPFIEKKLKRNYNDPEQNIGEEK